MPRGRYYDLGAPINWILCCAGYGRYWPKYVSVWGWPHRAHVYVCRWCDLMRFNIRDRQIILG